MNAHSRPPADQSDKVAGSDPGRKITVTFFKNFAASENRKVDLTMEELAGRILQTHAKTKDKLPWLKLAIFGTKKTPKGSLRHDKNLQKITGVELDYDCNDKDGKKVSFDRGLEMVKAMGINAIVYTTPSHTAELPRWRVLAPTSGPCEPQLRAKLVARMNGFMECILETHTESFTLSQAFYYGRSEENAGADHKCIVLYGDYIDKRDDLYKFQKDGEPKDADRNAFEEAADEQQKSKTFEERLAELGDGPGLAGFHNVLRGAVASYVGLHKGHGFDRDKLKLLLRDAINKAPKNNTRKRAEDIKKYLSDEYLDDDLIKSAVKKYAELPKGVKLDDFVAYMEKHEYIYIPTGAMWPGASVNGRIKPVPLLNSDGTPQTVRGGPSKGKAKTIPATEWLDQNRAAEQVTWAPGEPQKIRDKLINNNEWVEHPGVMCFNLYKPPTIVQGDAGKVGPWLDHIKRIYPNDHEHIVNWLAHRVQRPGDKINHSLLLGGQQGIGKDTILAPVKLAVGGENFRETSPSRIMAKYNPFLKAVILRINELHDLGDITRFAFYEHMKNISAAPPDVLEVEDKHIKLHPILNCVGVIQTTNHKTNGIYMPPDDRRTYVAWSKATKEEFTEDYWNGIYRWFTECGYRNVAAYLAQKDIRGFDPKKPPPKTDAWHAIVNSNRNPEESELADVLDALDNPKAVILEQLEQVAGRKPFLEGNIYEWLTDNKNNRAIPHRMETVGYVQFRYDGRKDGMWTINKRRKVIYVKVDLDFRSQTIAAQELVKVIEAETPADGPPRTRFEKMS